MFSEFGNLKPRGREKRRSIRTSTWGSKDKYQIILQLLYSEKEFKYFQSQKKLAIFADLL